MSDRIRPADAGIVPFANGGDRRAETLEQALYDVCHDRGGNLPFPLVLGVLRTLEHRLIKEQYAEEG